MIREFNTELTNLFNELELAKTDALSWKQVSESLAEKLVLSDRTIDELKAEIEKLKNPQEFLMNVDFITAKINGQKIEGLNFPTFCEHYLNNSTTTNQDKRYAYQEIVNGNLLARIINDDPTASGTSRAQLTIKLLEALPVIHFEYEFTLHPDIQHLQNYPEGLNWFSLIEFWLLRDDSMTGNTAGSMRVTMSIEKETASDKLHFTLDGEYQQPEELKHKDIWPELRNRTVPIPFGQRAKLNFYYLHSDKGRIVVTLDDNILFDFKGQTGYPDKPELFIRQVQPFKLYTSDKVMDWMRAQGKELSILYHNFKWFKS